MRHRDQATLRAFRALWVALASTVAFAGCAVPQGSTRASLQQGSSTEGPLSPHASYLRVEFTVENSKSGRQRLSGYVYNTWDKWAFDIQLLIETLDASGQVVGSTSVSVYGKVPPANRSYFDTPVPQGSRYRVTVRSVDWRTFGAGGA